MIDNARRRGFLTAQVCQYGQTNFPDGWFDALIAVFVVHYFIDERPFEEMRRILKRNGKLYYTLPPRHLSSSDLGSANLLNVDQEVTDYMALASQCGFTAVKRRQWTIQTSQKGRVVPVIEATKP